MKKYVVNIHMPIYLVMADSEEKAEETALKVLKDCVAGGGPIGLTLGAVDVDQFNDIINTVPSVICSASGKIVGHIDVGSL